MLAALVAACSESSGPNEHMTVTGVSPDSGPATGGTIVMIAGTNFPTSVDSVKVGTGRLVNLARTSSTQLTGATPASNVADTVDVAVYTTGAGNATCTACFVYNPTFTVTAVIPPSGPLAGGTAVTITGTNFPATVDSVRVGTARLESVVRLSATQLAGSTPVGSVTGAVDVTVYSAGNGSGTCSRCFTFFESGTIVVRGVIPAYGTLAGGTSVIIYGSFPVTVDSIRIGARLLAHPAGSGSGGLFFGATPAGSIAGPADVTVYSGVAWGTCVACFSYHSTAGFAHYAVTPLETGVDSSLAVDINDSGAVVGRVWSLANGWRGRLWPAAGSAVDLDTVLPVAINSPGTILACLAAPATGALVLWESGAIQPLGGSVTCGHASDINDRRQVALWSSGVYLWQNDSLTPLNTGGCNLMALGRMNDRGEVAASLLCVGAVGTVLSTAAPRYLFAGRHTAGAVAVNDSGVAVGLGEWIMGIASGGELSGVGPLPFVPTDINNSRQVLGAGSIWQDSAEASLSALVTDSSWRISGAVAINSRGQIAAYGVNTSTGQSGAVRLDPIAGTPGSPPTRRR